MKIEPFALEQYFERWEFKARHLLGSSDPETLGLAELLELADDDGRERWASLRLGYTEVRGAPHLREAIAELYDDATADDVVVFSGAQEPILAAFTQLLEPGDRVLSTWPTYQSHYAIPRALGAEVDLLRLDEREGWALDPQAVRRALRPETKALVLCAPHSPTGAIPDPASWREVLDLAADAGVTVLADEVYRFTEHDAADRLPNAADLHPSALSLGVMTKAFGLGGLRIGWLVVRDPAVRDRIVAFKHYSTICSSGPSEVLAGIALRARGEVLGRVQAIVRENLERLDGFFERHGDLVSWVPPRGANVGYVTLDPALPVSEFAQRLLDDEGVLILPGTVFDDGGNRFRLGYGRATMPEALAGLERGLDAARVR